MRTFGLIGKSLQHSFSPRYFSEKFNKENIVNAEYLPFELEDISVFKDLLSSQKNLKGLNVTIPYKEVVIPFLDELSIAASTIGAVNTISFKDCKLIGDNTDVIGFKNSLTPLLKSSHKKALILGTGGASKAIQYVLNELSIPFQLVSRNSSKKTISYQDSNDLIKSHTLIVNTTPLGTFPNLEESPKIAYEKVTTNHLMYDLVYNPEVTSFMKKSALNGATIKNGYEMLVMQAEASWKIWNT